MHAASSTPPRRLGYRWRVALAAVVAFAAGCSGGGSAAEPADGSASGSADGPSAKLHGHQLAQPYQPPRTLLRDIGGGRFDFADRVSGKVTLLYFGYTHCPDICPTTMADIATALDGLPKDTRQQVQVVMVTSDPARDKPKHLRAWLDQFDPAFVGVTGPIDDIVTDARSLGIGITPPKVGHGDYKVTHGAQVMVFYPDGKAHRYYGSGFASADLTADLKLIAAP